ncbi:hypothetical protein RHSIM_Rhsim13G0158900 [Rhododendron simsii]|uniref:Reverse transcriptase Ty1/copia-type domain-containing protein n=1 Tax=Rhododendron simsii TaxID=118357 RepID=A0A834FXF1_RHOSS|nr:hypothetical protein RHSIM_Rhsim13G0158900 [Rhododendron simsii]
MAYPTACRVVLVQTFDSHMSTDKNALPLPSVMMASTGFSWVMFLAHKDEAFPAFTKLCRKVQNEKGFLISSIRSDHGRELENSKKPNISHFRAFGCKCFVHNNDKDDLGKFDARSDEGIFVGYSTSSKAYRVFNKRTLVVEESVHVAFDETDHVSSKYFPSIDSLDDEMPRENSVINEIHVETTPNSVSASADIVDGVNSIAVEHENGVNSTVAEQMNELISITPQHRDVDTVPREWRYARDQFKEQIIGDPSQGMMTRSSLRNVCNNLAFLSQVEPKCFVEAEKDESWILAMQEELNQFERNQDFAKRMQGEFEMSMMGELTYFLGLQIKQSADGIFINQSKYIKDLLKRFDMEKAKPMGTPMSTSTKLDKDEMGKPFDEKKYRGMIGSLLYLTASRPDIMFSVCLCARFQSSPKESHHIAVKRIFKYLIGTPNLGLWYPRGTSIDLIGYSDADFAGCSIDRKSTSGTCQFLGHSLVSWFSKKQHSVALSTAEAEYVAVGSCCAQILWMKQQLEDFGLFFDHIPIKCDNTSAINLTKNPIQHSRTKHIDIRHHFIRDHVQRGDVVIDFVRTDNQLADIFTKPLSEDRFCSIRREIGMSNPC